MKKNNKRKELMDKLIREEVVKTVLNLIKEDRQLTMDEVAVQCGVSKGTLYNYFKNKKDLITFVHESVILPIKESSYKLFGTSDAPADKLHAFVDNVFRFQREYPLYFKFIQTQRSAATALEERMRVTIRPLVQLCREGMAAKEFVETDPYAMASMIFGTVVGSMESLAFRDKPINDMQILKKDIKGLLDRIILREQETLQ